MINGVLILIIIIEFYDSNIADVYGNSDILWVTLIISYMTHRDNGATSHYRRGGRRRRNRPPPHRHHRGRQCTLVNNPRDNGALPTIAEAGAKGGIAPHHIDTIEVDNVHS